MLDKSELLKMAAALSYHCPRSSNNSAEALAVLALDWEEDFRNFPDEAVRMGFRFARRTCKFFPSTAELIECIRRAHTELERRAPALPEPDQNPNSEENCERGLRHLAGLRAKLGMTPITPKGAGHAVP